MTVWYTSAELRAIRRPPWLEDSLPQAEASEPLTEVPDMAEAERVWKLLCQSAQGN